MMKIRHLAVLTNSRNQRMVEIQYFVIHRGTSHAAMSLLLNKNDVKHIPPGGNRARSAIVRIIFQMYVTGVIHQVLKENTDTYSELVMVSNL